MKRVMIVVNKWWECDPVLLALLSDNARPQASCPWAGTVQPPRPRPDPKKLPAENLNPCPRAVLAYKNFNAEVWCISDLLEHLDSSLQSSSEQKAKYLPKMFSYGPVPDLVFGVGTAEFPDAVCSQNGNVVIGTKVFMMDAHPNGSNPNSKWASGPFEQLIESTLTPALFSQLVAFDFSPAASRFLAVPLAPAATPRVLADYDYVGLAAVNVTDYSEYRVVDPLTAKRFWSTPRVGKAASVETTHGIIRVQSESPFLFVSGIVNRFGCYDQEVDPRAHSQNTGAAHNVGVVVSWLLARLDQIGCFLYFRI